jgi:hypothetical protein
VFKTIPDRGGTDEKYREIGDKIYQIGYSKIKCKYI